MEKKYEVRDVNSVEIIDKATGSIKVKVGKLDSTEYGLSILNEQEVIIDQE